MKTLLNNDHQPVAKARKSTAAKHIPESGSQSDSSYGITSKPYKNASVITNNKTAKQPKSSKTQSTSDSSGAALDSDSAASEKTTSKNLLAATELGNGKSAKLQEDACKVSEESSDSDSASDPDTSDDSRTVSDKPTTQGYEKVPSPKAAASASSSDSSSDSSDTQQRKKPTKGQKKKRPAAQAQTAKPEEVKVMKKRRTSISGTAVVTAVTTGAPVKEALKPILKSKEPRKSNAPFQRIKANVISFADDKLKDNSFDAKVTFGGRVCRCTYC